MHLLADCTNKHIASLLCHWEVKMYDYLCVQVEEILALIASFSTKCLRKQTWVYDPHAGLCRKGEIITIMSAALVGLRVDPVSHPNLFCVTALSYTLLSMGGTLSLASYH